MTNRAMIDRAVGILMSRSGITHDDAEARIRLLSRQENTKMAAVAEGIVAEAVRRARARRTEGT
jgi:AmiR/NasT family two-component response regulator